MTENMLHNVLIGCWLALAGLVFVILRFKTAPYGRHARRGWGPTLPERPGWVLMEAVSPIAMAVLFILGDRHTSIPALVFLGMWEVHYIHRAIIYPLRMKPSRKRIPVVIVLFGVLFNLGNSYLNGRYLFTLEPPRDTEWLLDPRFLAGFALFVAGLVINLQSDTILLNLRKPGETGYKIPRGGLYRWVSSPNYLGEILEWCGWALATWTLAGLSFAVWTAANLAPRARAHHRWYRETFPDYPRERRALVPYLY